MDDILIELLENLGVDPDTGEEKEGYQVFNLYDYDYFNEVYNSLEKNIEAERDSDNSSLDLEKAHITYIYKNLLVELVALFDEDDYTLNIYGEKTDK